MIALVVLAGPIAALALLLAVRRRSPEARSPRLDGVGAVACTVAAALFLASWPSATVRSWLGYVDPEQCSDKADPVPQAPPDLADVERLKGELRQESLDVGPRAELEAVGARQLDRVTGPGSSGRTDERWNVVGTDLGHPFHLDGRLGLMFGDTFAVPAPSGPGWRSNVLGWVDDPRRDRLEITAMPETPSGHQATELLGSLKINGWEQTVIPTNVVGIGDELVMHWMSVACWGAHGRWSVRQSGLAVSRDDGRTFRRVLGSTWPAGSGFAQVAFVPGDEWVHVFGIPEGRGGGVRLARVPTDEVLDVGAWRYFDGQGWSPREQDAVQLVPPAVGELSVAYHPAHDRWLMMYLDDVRGGLVLRTATALTGPWSRARLVASSTEFPSLYAPYLLPQLGDADEIRFTMSRFEGYHVVLMGAQLQPLPQPGSPPDAG